jgi:hypothetical protein
MCPRKFKYLYLDKLKPEKSKEIQRGLEVHDFINHFYDNLHFFNGDFSVNPEFYEPYMEMVLPDSKEQIENFINFERQRWQICRGLCPKNPRKLFIPLLREEKFTSEKLRQVTILDRMDARPDGNYTLVEIKTERFQPKEWKKTEFRREMMFEKTTAESSPDFQKRFPNNIIDFVIYFPRSNDVFMETYNYRTLSALKKSIEKMRMAVENNYFPCIVDYHCRFCFAAGFCNMEFEFK